jgi:hypothetical protein
MVRRGSHGAREMTKAPRHRSVRGRRVEL